MKATEKATIEMHQCIVKSSNWLRPQLKYAKKQPLVATFLPHSNWSDSGIRPLGFAHLQAI